MIVYNDDYFETKSYQDPRYKEYTDFVNSRIDEIKERRGEYLDTSLLECEILSTFGGLKEGHYRIKLGYMIDKERTKIMCEQRYINFEHMEYLIIRKTFTVITVEIQFVTTEDSKEKRYIMNIFEIPPSLLHILYLHRFDILERLAKDYGYNDKI